MTQFDSGRENGHDGRIDTELNDRDARALTGCMAALPEGGEMFTVVGENGGIYTVDAREARCTCPDYKHNLPTDDGEIFDDVDDGRPDGCDCGDWNADADLPCWPCYRAGFETPASAGEEGADA